MILTASDIARRLRAAKYDEPDSLVITPALDIDAIEASGSASVDLRLGTWFVSPRSRRTPMLDITAPESTSYQSERLTKSTYIPFGGQFILHPGGFVLAVTLEWVRLPRDLAGSVVGRSSWGRRGLIIATATGVHPSFSGCLTLELANVGELPIAIYPGMSICQLFLECLTQPTTATEQSAYVGYGRPVLGRIKPDKIAQRLRGN